VRISAMPDCRPCREGQRSVGHQAGAKGAVGRQRATAGRGRSFALGPARAACGTRRAASGPENHFHAAHRSRRGLWRSTRTLRTGSYLPVSRRAGRVLRHSKEARRQLALVLLRPVAPVLFSGLPVAAVAGVVAPQRRRKGECDQQRKEDHQGHVRPPVGSGRLTSVGNGRLWNVLGRADHDPRTFR
jgi:hypothetical protein